MSEASVSAAVRFAGVYRRHLSLVLSLEPPDADVLLHRRLIMVSILDALARAVLPNLEGRERLVNFLRQFVAWPDSERLSLPHLARLLSRTTDPSFDPIRSFASTALARWLPGRVIPLSEDPEPAEVLAFLGDGASLDTRIAEVKLRRLQHSELFYTYRNSLVHELRPPAHELRLWDTPDPNYVHLTLLSGDTSWQLQYGNAFLARIASDAVEAVQAHLIRKDIDVFQVIESGEYWLAELNR